MKTPLGPVPHRHSFTPRSFTGSSLFFSLSRHSTVPPLARRCQIMSSLSHHAYVWSMVLAGRGEGKDLPAKASWFFWEIGVKRRDIRDIISRWFLFVAFVSHENILIFEYHHGILAPSSSPSSPSPPALNFGLTSRLVLPQGSFTSGL